MSIGSQIYNAVQDNHSKKFADLLDAYFLKNHSLSYVIQDIFEYNPMRYCIAFPKTTEGLKTARAQAKCAQRQAISSFCVMLEQWLGMQNPELREQILTCSHYKFHIHFLQNAKNPVDVINRCKAKCYLTMNDHRYDKNYGDKTVVIDCEPLVQMLDAKLGVCVDAIVSQHDVQHILSHKVLGLDTFFEHLLKRKNTSHALHYLECMQHNFTPHWVGVFLNALFATKNSQVGQWLATNPRFAQFLTTSSFATVWAQTVSWKPRAYKDLLLYEPFLTPMLWNAVVKNTTLACVGGTYFSKWVEHIQRPQFDGQRVAMVQQYFERHFARNQDDYKYGQCAVDNKCFKKIVSPVLDILTADDVAQWYNTQWFLDRVYRVHEHNCFLRNRIAKAIEHNGCESARKI